MRKDGIEVNIRAVTGKTNRLIIIKSFVSPKPTGLGDASVYFRRKNHCTDNHFRPLSHPVVMQMYIWLTFRFHWKIALDLNNKLSIIKTQFWNDYLLFSVLSDTRLIFCRRIVLSLSGLCLWINFVIWEGTWRAHNNRIILLYLCHRLSRQKTMCAGGQYE